MRDAPPSRVLEAIAGSIGEPVDALRWTRADGSALNATFRVDARHDPANGRPEPGRELFRRDRRWFVKLGRADRRAMYDAEAAGLRLLASANAVRVPQPIATGEAHGHAWLVLEWLDLEGGGRDAALGRALATLHRTVGPRFGWDRDNTIGTTPQVNAWGDDWARFFRDRRLAPQLARAAAAGHRAVAQAGERLLSRVESLLAGHAPAASLLHGDLWSGNAARSRAGEPVIFDPATYYGDREADLAMTELFGGFAPSFYAAYREAWPLEPGYDVRRTLYNLYHVLNHLNLFGAGYGPQALQMIGALAREA